MSRFVKIIAIWLVVIMAQGSVTAGERQLAPVLPSKDPEKLRVAGREQAVRDLAEGKRQLLEAGTIAIYTPGVPSDIDSAALAKLPRVGMPSGCTNAEAMLWVTYAKAYNEVMVERVTK